MIESILPTEREVSKWMVETIRHSCNTEYYFEKLGFGDNNPERPHDLVGYYNKFEWNVIKGMALKYREPQVDFEKYILPSIYLHREQYHHKMWNNQNPEANSEDMYVGAIDAICSLLENRKYTGGEEQNEHHGKRHYWYQLENTFSQDKEIWAQKIIPRMKDLPKPKIKRIKTLRDFPNIGLKDVIFKAIVDRTNETIEELRNKHGYFK